MSGCLLPASWLSTGKHPAAESFIQKPGVLSYQGSDLQERWRGSSIEVHSCKLQNSCEELENKEGKKGALFPSKEEGELFA